MGGRTSAGGATPGVSGESPPRAPGQAPAVAAPTIRLASPRDLDVVLAIRCEAILALAPERVTLEEARRWAERPDRAAKTLASIEGGRLWLDESAGEAAGWLEVRADFVDGLYVRPRLWRRGHGSRLMDVAETMIRERGFAAVRLDASSTAQSFYQRRGYMVSGPRDPGRGTPMSKELLPRA